MIVNLHLFELIVVRGQKNTAKVSFSELSDALSIGRSRTIKIVEQLLYEAFISMNLFFTRRLSRIVEF